MLKHYSYLIQHLGYALLIVFGTTVTELNASNLAKIDTVLVNIMNLDDELEKTTKLNNWAYDIQLTQLKESSKLFDLAYQIASKNNFTRQQINAKFGLAKNFKHAMNYQQALINYKEYGKLAKLINDSIDMAIALHYQGEMYYSLGDYEKSEQVYFETIDLLTKLNDYASIASCYNNLGLIYYNTDWTKALKYYKKGLTLKQKYDKENNSEVLMNNIACIYMNSDSLVQAKELLYEALDIATKRNNYQALTLIYSSIAGYHEISGQLNNVEGWYKKAYQLYDEHPHLNNRTRLLHLMQEFYYSQAEYETAYLYFREYIHLSDSLIQVNDKEKYIRQEFNDEMEKIKFQRQIDTVEQEKRVYVYRILLIATSIVFLTLIIFSLIRRKQNKRRLLLTHENQQLKEQLLLETVGKKDNELTSKALLLNERNELIKSVIEKLNNCKANLKKSNVEPIQNVIDSLETGLNERQWQEFEDSFNSVHPDFNNKLLQNFPNLSPSDLKLCALLRLNMSSKEIAQITHMTISSVDVARSRIRKKLNISDQKTNLIVFLSEL